MDDPNVLRAQRIKAGLQRDMDRRHGAALSYDEIAAIYGDQDEHTGPEEGTEEAGQSEEGQREPGSSWQEADHARTTGDPDNVQQEDGSGSQQDNGEEASEATTP